MTSRKLAAALERLYRKYNRREFVHPDPLEFLYNYSNPDDREVAGLIASSLAYGNVRQILKAVGWVLERLGPSPAGYLAAATPPDIKKRFAGFRYRFTRDNEIVSLLSGIRTIRQRHGSLENFFARGVAAADSTAVEAARKFITGLYSCCGDIGTLVPDPSRGSAFKRFNLFLRWMVRQDEVDPGGWKKIPPAKLIVPVDVHMHRIARAFCFTSRKNADLRTALEITAGFSKLNSLDPVKYDFCLTRFGIRDELDLEMLCKNVGLNTPREKV